MEVAELTARLTAEIAGFQANLRIADRQVNDLRKDIVELEASAAGMGAAFEAIRLDTARIAESRNAARSLADALRTVRDAATESKFALMQVGMSEAQVGRFTAETAIMVEDLDRVGDAAGRARRQVEQLELAPRPLQRDASGRFVPYSQPRDSFGRFASPDQFVGGMPPSFVRGATPTPQELADFNHAQYLASLPPDRSVWTYRAQLARLLDEQRSAGGGLMMGAAPGRTSFAEGEQTYRDMLAGFLEAQRGSGGGIMMGPGSTLRDFGPRRALGFGEEGLGPFTGGSRRTFPFVSEEEAALSEGGTAVEREARRVARDGGGGGRSRSFSFLSGILPGGRRAGAGVVTAGIGLAGAVGPAAVPAVVGLGAAGTAGLEALMGGAATLKLAFADLSSAVFTNKQKFDELTPVQQQFVLTLKSIDTGFMKPLERLAQQNVLPGLTAALHSALSPATVVAARGAVSGFGGAISGGTQELGRLVGSTDFARTFGSVMATDAHILRDMFSALANVIDAFFLLQQAAGPLILWLDKGILAFTKWFDGAIKAAQASGSLAHFFGEAKTALQALGNLVGSVAGALHSASAALGGFQLAIGVINTLSRAFDILGSFLNANRATLNAFFQGAQQSINDVLSLIRQLMRLLTPLLTLLNAIARAFGGWRVVIDAVMAVFVLKFVAGLKVVQSLEAALLGIGPAATTGVGAADVQLALFNAQAARGVGILAGLRAGLLGLRGLALGFAVLAAPIAGLVALEKGTPNKNIGSTMDGKTIWQRPDGSYFYTLPRGLGGLHDISKAEASALLGRPVGTTTGGPGTPNADAAAKAAHGVGVLPPQFKEPGIETPYLSMLLANAQATPSFADDKAVIRRIIAVLEARKRQANNPTAQTQLQDAINNYNLQLQSSSPFGTPGGFPDTPKGRQASALNQVLPSHLQAALSSGEANLVSARSALQGAQSPQEQIKASQDLIRVAKEYEAQIQRSLDHLRGEHETGKLLVAQKREELALTRQQVAAERDIRQAMKEQADAHLTIKAEHILGIAPGGQQVIPSARQLLFRERQMLTRDAARAHLDTSRFQHENVQRIISDMRRQGFVFPQSTLDSLEKINKVLEMTHKGQKLGQDVLTNIRDRLAQINDTLKQNKAGLSNYVPYTSEQMTAGLGLDRTTRMALESRIAQSLAHHGMHPRGGAAAGIPLNPDGSPVGSGRHSAVPIGAAPPLVSEHGRWSSYNNYTVKIIIDGTRTGREVARAVREELLKTSRRNSAQTRGPNAGRGVGLG